LQCPIGAELDTLRIAEAKMTLNGNSTLYIKAGSRRSEYTAAGLYAILCPYADLRVYDSCVCARFCIDYNGLNRAGGKTEGLYALKAGVSLVNTLQVILLQYDTRES
jgi:hypothetical protein